jgi:hypothetical protein
MNEKIKCIAYGDNPEKCELYPDCNDCSGNITDKTECQVYKFSITPDIDLLSMFKWVYVKPFHVEEEDDGTEWLNVTGVNVNTRQHYGIEFCKWSDWVSMFITQETLDAFSKEDIVAACLYEMTFFGFTEKNVMDEKDKLEKSVEEAKEALKNEKK